MRIAMSGETWLHLWLWLFVGSGPVAAIATGWLTARKIQPRFERDFAQGMRKA